MENQTTAEAKANPLQRRNQTTHQAPSKAETKREAVY